MPQHLAPDQHPSVLDVAAYVLASQGPMPALKMQKLCYYCLAWHLAWEGAPLFPEPFEAWPCGPVCPDLYRQHRGMFLVERLPGGNPDRLDADERESVDAVLDHYGPMSEYQLVALVKSEGPWKTARAGLAVDERRPRQINAGALAELFESLIPAGDGSPA